MPCIFVFNIKVGTFYPDVIPYGMLGPFGRFWHYMNYSHPHIVRGLFYFTVLAHLGEGFYAYTLTRYGSCTIFCVLCLMECDRFVGN